MRFITPEKRRSVDHSEPPRTLLVIAAGLPRCATSSLHHVFENKLDLEPAMHMAYVVPSAERQKLFLAAVKERDKAKRQAVLHQLFDGYHATSDLPGCFFVDDLMEMYPTAKLVLNKRAKVEDWVRSAKALEAFGSKWFFAIVYWIPLYNKAYEIKKGIDARRMSVLGIDPGSPSVEMYEAHLNWVRGLAKARGVALLEWMPEMGYAPLCKFLGKPIPEEPFPRLNEAKYITIIKVYVLATGFLAWAGVLGLLAAPFVASYAWFRI